MSLKVEGLEASYGTAQVLFGIDFTVDAGRAVALLGRNGVGKTTTIRTIMGLLPARSGAIWFDGARLDGAKPHVIARHGLGLVPEGRQIFAKLSVEENLLAFAAKRSGASAPWTLERVFRQFPQLAERRRLRGGVLSGGEQQMLAIGRALVTNPRLLILDEATEGLAPVVRREIWRALAAIKAEGLALLIVDRDLDALLHFVDAFHVVAKGKTVWSGSAEALTRERRAVEEQIGI